LSYPAHITSACIGEIVCAN